MIIHVLILILFSICVVIIAWIGRPGPKVSTGSYLTFLEAIIGITTILSIGIYAYNQSTISAFLSIILIFASFIKLERIINSGNRKFHKWLIILFLAFFNGILGVFIAQWESKFSDEEFFSIIQAGILSILWFCLWLVSSVMPIQQKFKLIPVRKSWVFGGFIGLVLLTFLAIFYTYQRSFFPPIAPTYPGITQDEPFYCGQSESLSGSTSSEQVFESYLEQIDNNANKEAPEFGLLAFGLQDEIWAKKFKESLIKEALEGKFTQPANSVKYTQYQAALRLYYYAKVSYLFPGLFTSNDQKVIQDWFASINRRALQIEWIDWVYAIAFSKKPEGPYENQEIGAGLLSLLEKTDMADPQLASKNTKYLNENPRGWLTRFRNTDDSIFYQPEWSDNAFFQSLFFSDLDENNLWKSLEWLLLQSIPDGAPLRYNQPSPADMVGALYRGAILTGDPQFLWAAYRGIEYLQENEGYLSARPGADSIVSLDTVAPTTGSCLIFGDSGLPNQQGPLAPDKIVFRDGWFKDSSYLLLNLRFTGWHRYKGTNNIILVYKGSPLVEEKIDGKLFDWLPEGRSLFRDKRIPRENLNGLVVPNSGMNAVISLLTGIGSKWAQDPPYYAVVEDITFLQDRDFSKTQINHWRGWDHTREITFFHQGPIIVHDSANGPSNQAASLFWHFPQVTEISEGHYQIGEGANKGQIALLAIDNGTIATDIQNVENPSSISLEYSGNSDGNLELVTIFLFDEWIDAEITVDETDTNIILKINNGNQEIVLPLGNDSGS